MNQDKDKDKSKASDKIPNFEIFKNGANSGLGVAKLLGGISLLSNLG